MKDEWLWPPKHGLRSTKNRVSKWKPFSEVFIVTAQKESQSKVSVKVIAAAKCWGLCHKSQCSPVTAFAFEWGEVGNELAYSIWWWERCWVSHRWVMCCCEEGSQGKFPTEPANTPAFQKPRECQSTHQPCRNLSRCGFISSENLSLERNSTEHLSFRKNTSEPPKERR